MIILAVLIIMAVIILKSVMIIIMAVMTIMDETRLITMRSKPDYVEADLL